MTQIGVSLSSLAASVTSRRIELADVWIYDGHAWTEIVSHNESQAEQRYPVSAWDPAAKRVLAMENPSMGLNRDVGLNIHVQERANTPLVAHLGLRGCA